MNDELETLQAELDELNKRRNFLESRIKTLENQQTRAEIIAAGFDPDGRYIVDRAFEQYYRDTVHWSGVTADFCDHLFVIEWASEDKAYIISDEPYGATSLMLPTRFLRQALKGQTRS